MYIQGLKELREDVGFSCTRVLWPKEEVLLVIGWGFLHPGSQSEWSSVRL